MKILSALCAVLLLRAASAEPPSAYDPLNLTGANRITTRDFDIYDTKRNRKIPVKVYLPATAQKCPIILFSHGLGGSRENNAYLGEHWSARGYVCVFLQHPGSDEKVWQDKDPQRAVAAMQRAANIRNFLSRIRDVPAVLDQLAAWNGETGHPLAGRLDPARVGMSGHSFGAVTTQAVSGQAFPTGQSVTDPRIGAALAFSPSIPTRGDPETAFGSVKIPWMLMTGTEDNSPIGNASPESRQKVYPALPPGRKYELVLFGARHSAFSSRAPARDPRNPAHHHAILALSTAFWDSTLKGDPRARAWLDGTGPASLLEPRDRWQHK